jgi:transposase InsO family protein
MKKTMDDRQLDLGIWRFGIISPLLHRDVNGLRTGELLERMAQSNYLHPDGKSVRLSPETLRKWLYRYRQGGLVALGNRKRSDAGVHQIPQKLVDELFKLRKQHPRWTLAAILEELVKDGLWDGRRPGRSTLYRYAARCNLKRDPHLSNTPLPRAFSFDAFGQLWVADFLHGPKLKVGKQKRKTYLHVILDDCCRYVVAAGFYHHETVRTLISELMAAVRRFGIPQRFYTDNGPCYASRHLKIVCARIGTVLTHTPPYRPQGRGKVERLFRTVRDQFLAKDNSRSLEQLNQGLQNWLAQYHQRLHRSLDCSPLEKRMQVENCCRPVHEVADIEHLFLMQRRCRVYQDGTIRLHKRRFEVPQCTPGSRTLVFYQPWDLSRVYYGDDMAPARPLDQQANARRFEHPNRA